MTEHNDEPLPGPSQDLRKPRRHTSRATAIHEAGHAIAHARLGIDQHSVSIVRDPVKRTLGAVAAEGANHVWDASQARDQVIAYLAGYAAMRAAGYSRAEANAGAWGDFEHAQHLIDFWLDRPLPYWKARAVALMRKPDNVKAVQILARWLRARNTLEGNLLSAVICYATGEWSEADLAQNLVFTGIVIPEPYQKSLLVRDVLRQAMSGNAGA